jgi:hypothetical protein
MMRVWRDSSTIPDPSTRDGDELSAPRPCYFTPDTHWKGGWLSPRASLAAGDEEKYPALARNRNTEIQTGARRYT